MARIMGASSANKKTVVPNPKQKSAPVVVTVLKCRWLIYLIEVGASGAARPGIASQKPTNAMTIIPGPKAYDPDIGACTAKIRSQNICVNILSAVT
jgi:hypothetical protein